MQTYPPLEVKIWGDYACFTRPEMKVERVSYPVMTPSAARGALEAIFWKPEFIWRIKEIRVLKEIRHFSLVRNEVSKKAVFNTASKWSKNDGGFFADEIKNRAQRHSLVLRDVAYIVAAEIVPGNSSDENLAKYRDMFRRRVNKGQCYHHPYLGCREFDACFGWPDETDVPIDHTDDLGLILYDIEYNPDGSGRGQPLFFRGRIEHGIMRIPDRAEITAEVPI